jgi:hypothetical protein
VVIRRMNRCVRFDESFRFERFGLITRILEIRW